MEGRQCPLKNSRSSLCSLVEDKLGTIKDYEWIGSFMGGLGEWLHHSEIIVTKTVVSWLILQMRLRIRKTMYAVYPMSLC